MTRNIKKKYEDMIDDLSMDTDDRYKEFLKARPETIVIDNLIFDGLHLDGYFRCEGCRERKPKAFCCRGHDLELTRRDLEAVDKVLPPILEKWPRLKTTLDGQGYWKYGDGFELMMRRKKSSDECVLSIPGGKGCYLHRYALDRGLDPIDVKPYVCSLYPVVVIIIGDDVVVTTVNRESETILDCGGATHPCVAKKGKRDDHALIKSKGIMVKMFGAKIYDELAGKILGR